MRVNTGGGYLPPPIWSPHAQQPSRHPERVRHSGWRHACLHHGPEEPHHLLQPGVHRRQRVRPGRTAGPAAQHRAPPRHASRGLPRHVGHPAKRLALVGAGEEPAQERRPLLGHGQRHARGGKRPGRGLHVGAHQAHAAANRGRRSAVRPHARRGPERTRQPGPEPWRGGGHRPDRPDAPTLPAHRGSQAQPVPPCWRCRWRARP